MPYEIPALEVRTPLLHCSRKVGAKTLPFRYAMVLGLVNQTMEVYGVKLQSVNGNFEMEADVTKVEKPQLVMLENTTPPLQNKLWSVLVRRRFNPVALTGDIN